jgi:hypothetical protein
MWRRENSGPYRDSKSDASVVQPNYLTPAVPCISDSRRGFGSDIGSIDHFNTQLVITLNYSVIVDLHTLQMSGNGF